MALLLTNRCLSDVRLLFNSSTTISLMAMCMSNLSDWCLTPNLAVVQQYRGVVKFKMIIPIFFIIIADICIIKHEILGGEESCMSAELGPIQLLSYEAMTWVLSDVKNVDIWDGNSSGIYEKYIKDVIKNKEGNICTWG